MTDYLEGVGGDVVGEGNGGECEHGAGSLAGRTAGLHALGEAFDGRQAHASKGHRGALGRAQHPDGIHPQRDRSFNSAQVDKIYCLDGIP